MRSGTAALRSNRLGFAPDRVRPRRGAVPGGQGGQLDRPRLPFPYGRGDVRAAPALPDDRRAIRRARGDPARHHRLRRQHAVTRVRGRVVWNRRGAGCEQAFHHPSGLPSVTESRPSLQTECGEVPRYNYDDMVAAQYKLVTEGLGSAACAWCSATRWAACTRDLGVAHPSSWMRWCDGVAAHGDVEPQLDDAAAHHRCDPQGSDWKDGNYTTQPKGFRGQRVLGIATNGGTCPTKAAPRASSPTSCSTSAWGAFTPTPTTFSMPGIPRATTTRRRAWSASGHRCWRSTPPTTSAIRRDRPMERELNARKNGKLY